MRSVVWRLLMLMLGSWACLPSPAAAAPVLHYLWNTTANVIAPTDFVWFQGEVPNSQRVWELDRPGNRIGYSGALGALPTNLFTVADILDITYTGGTSHDSVFLRTTTGFYIWNLTANLIAPTDFVFFQGEVPNPQNVWELDRRGNQIGYSGALHPLPTDLFTVADILDITYTGGTSHDSVFLRTATGFYIWNLTANLIAPTDFVFFQGEASNPQNVWELDRRGNQIGYSGALHPLPTSLFTVADILDITYTGGTDHDTVFLTIQQQDSTGVPEPASMLLVAAGLASLLTVRALPVRRRGGAGKNPRGLRAIEGPCAPMPPSPAPGLSARCPGWPAPRKPCQTGRPPVSRRAGGQQLN